MTGRNLRPFWSKLSWASQPSWVRRRIEEGDRAQVGLAEAASALNAQFAELEAERDAAVQAALELAEGVRAALLSAGYFHVGEGVVAAVQHLAGEYVQTVAELRALKLHPAATGDRAGRAEVAELRRLLAASPEQAHRNCLDLSDRLAQLRREKEDLEQMLAEKEGRAAQVNIIDREGSPWAPC